MKIKTGSSKDTELVAKKFISGLISFLKNKESVVLALEGDLGAGKTTFVKGIFSALKIKGSALSPTFIIVRKKKTANKVIKNVFHMDAYRLKKEEELFGIGFFEMLKTPASLTIVEWAGNIKKAIPKDAIWIKFSHGKKENERIIEIKK